MRHIKSKSTKIELKVRGYLYGKGIRFYVNNNKHLCGNPDIHVSRYNAVIFVNGCFWHKHENCILSKPPKTNTQFWAAKLERNKTRDVRNYKELSDRGFKVIVIWECSLQSKMIDSTLSKLYDIILTGSMGLVYEL
jgi:DNA mismatch endonuclease (patch repair protein)